MFKYKLSYFAIILFAFLLASCGSLKTITGHNDPATLNNEMIMQKISDNNLQFEYLQFDSDVSFDNNETNMDGSAEIRMKDDEYIWVVVKKFGFEIARALIKPDSFFIIDRFNRNYSSGTTEYFANLYDIPFGFGEMQNLLAGNVFTHSQKIKSRNKIKNNHLIETTGEKFNAAYTINNSFYTIFARIFDYNNKSLEITNSDFRKISGKAIPYNRVYNFSASSTEKQVFEVKINEFNINKEHKIKFEIPSGYEKN
jgi:hypothetical protein